MVALFIDTQKAPVLAVDLLAVNEFALRVVACRYLRQVGDDLLLPSLCLAFLNKLFQWLQIAVALRFVRFDPLFNNREPRDPPHRVGRNFK